MNRRLAMLVLGALCLAGGARPEAACPLPDDFSFEGVELPAASAAIAKGNLTVLALGGSSTLGSTAGGAAFTYPARLEARLREALPKTTVTVVVRAVARQSDSEMMADLDKSLATVKPALVIWGPGGSAAARGDDLDTFIGIVSETIGKIRATGTDLVLMSLQYAPSVSRLVNLPPYRMAVIRAADDAGVPVLDRYELMRFWSDSDFLNLDATNANDRIRVSRTLYDCMAEILAKAIVDAPR